MLLLICDFISNTHTHNEIIKQVPVDQAWFTFQKCKEVFLFPLNGSTWDGKMGWIENGCCDKPR